MSQRFTVGCQTVLARGGVHTGWLVPNMSGGFFDLRAVVTGLGLRAASATPFVSDGISHGLGTHLADHGKIAIIILLPTMGSGNVFRYVADGTDRRGGTGARAVPGMSGLSFGFAARRAGLRIEAGGGNPCVTGGRALSFPAIPAGFRDFTSAVIPGVIAGRFFFLVTDGADGGIGTGAQAVPRMTEGISFAVFASRTGFGRLTGGVYPGVPESFSFCLFTDSADLGIGTGGVGPGMIGYFSLGFLA